jgi:DNA-binding CsgD family transcriptional regulator
MDLIPNGLQRAAAFASERAHKYWHVRQLEREADCVPYGRIVLDAQLHVLHANRSARAMAAAGDAFGIEGDRLELRRPNDQAVIVGGMRELDRGREEPFVATLPRRSGRWPYLARLTVLEYGVPVFYELTLIDREPAQLACDSLMLTGFDLTRAEARVVGLLIEGVSSEEIAAHLGIARGTVKLHVQHAMAKLGVRRRSELLRRVLAPWIAAMPAWPPVNGVEGSLQAVSK